MCFLPLLLFVFIFGAHQIGRFGERQKFDLPAQQIRLMREKWFCDALHADCGELFADDELELVVADGYAVRELAVVLREGDRDEGHLVLLVHGEFLRCAERLADFRERGSFSFR